MSTFLVIDDQLLSERISIANSRVVFISPAVSEAVAETLGKCFLKAGRISITVVLDPDEEPYRLGYGDRKGLERVQQLAEQNLLALRSQPGIRIGLLLVDDDILIWSPTPRAVETRAKDEPNGVDLSQSFASPSTKLNSLEDVRREMARVYREARGGIIDSSEAGRLAYILSGVGKLIEATEIEKRLSQMERKLLK